MSAKQRPLETTYIVDPSDEEEDDEDWEDVELSAVASSPIPGPSPAVSSRHAGDLQITFDDTEKSPLSGTTTRRARAGRRTLSAAEKRLRWDAHKAHILCLLVHVTRRNAWCNDSVVQACQTLLLMLPSPLLFPFVCHRVNIYKSTRNTSGASSPLMSLSI